MSDAITIEVESREGTGTGPARRLRREGLVPAVLYTHGEAATGLKLNHHRFEQMLRQHASESLLVDLDFGQGQTRKALVKEIQRHPLGGNVLHVDFQEVSMTEKIRFAMPVELVGTPEGVKIGGVIESLIHEIEVECLPADLLEKLAVDVSGMQIGDHLLVSQLQLDPERYSILTPGHIAVAIVETPRVAEEESTEEGAAGAAAGEPEVLTAKAEDKGE